MQNFTRQAGFTQPPASPIRVEAPASAKRPCPRVGRRCTTATGEHKRWFATRREAKNHAAKFLDVYACPGGGYHLASKRGRPC